MGPPSRGITQTSASAVRRDLLVGFRDFYLFSQPLLTMKKIQPDRPRATFGLLELFVHRGAKLECIKYLRSVPAVKRSRTGGAAD